jgi:hypothetical protein
MAVNKERHILCPRRVNGVTSAPTGSTMRLLQGVAGGVLRCQGRGRHDRRTTSAARRSAEHHAHKVIRDWPVDPRFLIEEAFRDALFSHHAERFGGWQGA